MCGRIVLSVAPHRIAEEFYLDMVPDLLPRYNIAPTQDVAAVLPNPRSDGRLVEMFRWGLVPHWSKGPDEAARMINARSETVLEKGSFRDSFRERRCLVPVNGFYEWQKRPDGKQPFLFRRRDAGLFALAGIWDRWEYPGGRELRSCSILTTEANRVMRPVHHRMPVILAPEAWEKWLRLPADRAAELTDLLRPLATDDLLAAPVTREVNRPAFDEPRCLEPIWDDPGGQLNLFG
ncbi:SOS response-associated peptidase [bacterium]|nr:SOS response-associated peptidase [bacterium]